MKRSICTPVPGFGRAAIGGFVGCLVALGLWPVAALADAGAQPGQTFRDCTECPEMAVVPAGSFKMGSSASEVGRDADEGPVHPVNIGSFAIGKFPVTQGQWRAVMGRNPSSFARCGETCPVENVSWSDAKEFIARLSARTGHAYRLPSEAEWEYACRAGRQQLFCGGDDADLVGWYDRNSGRTTHPVGQKQPNAWGLFDMTGNVWQWMEDCNNASYGGAPADGAAWTGGDCQKRVLRGGAWGDPLANVRAASRAQGIPAAASFNGGGFRLAMTVTSAQQATGSATQAAVSSPAEAKPSQGPGAFSGVYRALRLSFGAGINDGTTYDYVTFFPDGRRLSGIPDGGMEHFDEAAGMRRSPTLWMTYRIVGNTIESTQLPSVAPGDTSIEKLTLSPDRRTIDAGHAIGGNFTRLDPCEGLKLQGVFRRSDYAQPYTSRQGIAFSADGSFVDEGIFKAAGVLTPNGRGGDDWDDGKPGRGQYRFGNYTLELSFSDGRIKRAFVFCETPNTGSAAKDFYVAGTKFVPAP